MSVFGAYSRYYNLLYRDKNYAGETAYVQNLIERYCSGAVSLLDLGCGTGRHGFLFAESGYDVTGVDRSEEMLTVAASRLASLHGQASSVSFVQGDIRSVQLKRTYDAVVSLFHVMSYQTANDDLAAAFATASAHLRPGGVFIFDCWYGPAVLTDRPAVRVRRLENDEISVTRIAEPRLYASENLVVLDFNVLIRDKQDHTVEELHEEHRMRYLFSTEVESFSRAAGLICMASEEWMTGRPPGFDTWGVCFVLKKPAGSE